MQGPDRSHQSKTSGMHMCSGGGSGGGVGCDDSVLLIGSPREQIGLSLWQPVQAAGFA